MASFTTRVELHYARENDYEILHAEMAKEGFKRTITSSDGVTYRLPTAEYNYVGDKTRDDVLDKAKAAAARTRKEFCVLVTESAGRSWHNLERA